MTFNLTSFFNRSNPKPNVRTDTNQRLISALDYLGKRGFSKGQLARMNPPSIRGRVPSLAAAQEYFSKSPALQGDNLEFANRVIYVANLHRWKEGNFEPLIERSLEKWPLGQMAA